MSELHLVRGSLPHSLSSERAVLGMMMVRGAADVLEVAETLDGEHFYLAKHRALFELLCEIAHARQPIELLAIVDYIERHGRSFDAFGGLTYLTSLADNIPSIEYLAHFAALVRDDADRRALLCDLAQVRESLSTGGALADAYEQLLALAGPQNQAGLGVSPVGEVITASWPALEREAAAERATRIATGIPSLDAAADFGGLSCEGMTILLGASGMGKTSVLNRLALGVAATGVGVFLHGTETSVPRRQRDLLFTLAGVDASAWAGHNAARVRARQGGYSLPYSAEVARDLAALRRAAVRLSSLPLYLSGSGKTVESVTARARQLHRGGTVGLVVVDYLQDFPPSPAVPPGRPQQVSHASSVLKALAAELEIPVVVGAQRSGEKELKPSMRSGDSHEWLIPQGKDVQHSSGPHQDAEEVYALNRWDWWRSRYPDVDDANPFPHLFGTIEMVARKRRNGDADGRWSLSFDGPTKWVGEPLGGGR